MTDLSNMDAEMDDAFNEAWQKLRKYLLDKFYRRHPTWLGKLIFLPKYLDERTTESETFRYLGKYQFLEGMNFMVKYIEMKSKETK